MESIGTHKVYNTNTKNGNYVSSNGVIHKNCVVDEDYEGEIHINLHNVGVSDQKLEAGDKIVQFILEKQNYIIPEQVWSEADLFDGSLSERGEGGFGSTGTK